MNDQGSGLPPPQSSVWRRVVGFLAGLVGRAPSAPAPPPPPPSAPAPAPPPAPPSSAGPPVEACEENLPTLRGVRVPPANLGDSEETEPLAGTLGAPRTPPAPNVDPPTQQMLPGGALGGLAGPWQDARPAEDEEPEPDYFVDLDVSGSQVWDSQAAGAFLAGDFAALGDVDPRDLLRLGLEVGPYRVEGLLGTGAMSVVFRGRHRDTAEPVAIKILKRSVQEKPDNRERFRREAVVVSRVRHEHVIGVRMCGIVEGRPFMVLELLEGGSVRDLIDREGGRIAVERAAAIAGDVLAGLEAAHAVGVVHRDIKPDNLLLTSGGQAKIGDFGLVKILDYADRPEFELTGRGMAVGTPIYMAPEQAMSGDVTPASDIYAVGLVLFELLTGRLPLEAKTSIERVAKQMREPPPRVRTVRADVPPPLDEALARMLAPRLADRLPDAAHARWALAAAGGRPLQAVELRLEWPGGRRDLKLTPGGRVVLGRGEQADVRIRHAKLSRNHLELRVGSHGVEARDRESTNGSFLGEQQLSRRVVLVPGRAAMRLGDVPLRVSWRGR